MVIAQYFIFYFEEFFSYFHFLFLETFLSNLWKEFFSFLGFFVMPLSLFKIFKQIIKFFVGGGV